MNNLATRVVVAIIGIPIMVWIILTGGWALALLVAILSALGVREFYSLGEKKAAHAQVFAGMLIAFLIPMIVQFDTRSEQKYLGIILVLSVVLILTLELWRNKPHPLFNISATLGGIIYVSGLLSTLVLLRNMELVHSWSDMNFVVTRPGWQGFVVLCMFITVWVSDSAAYFTGMKFGSHKIFPRVSPKKSWEGTVAGFIVAPFACHISLHLMLPEFPISHSFILGAIIGVVGPIGDFAESLLKRDAAIKDSSGLIPGHGGVLDRFDSILFVTPVVWVYMRLFL